MSARFSFPGLPSSVTFGRGTISEVLGKLHELGKNRALVLSTRGQRRLAERVSVVLGASARGLFDGAVMHTPVEVSEEATATARSLGADIIVAVGGGSTIGLSKAVALRTGLPQIVLPTTYAGSEVTPVLGETQNGVKTVKRIYAVVPEYVIYDVDLSTSLPLSVSGVSAVNALAHAAEALYAPDANGLVSLMALEGSRAILDGSTALYRGGDDLMARERLLYGAWLCGACLATVTMGLHHKLCHVLGGSFGLPHAETHTAILPHVLRFNAEAAGEPMAHLAGALRSNDATGAVVDLQRVIGAPQTLDKLGLQEADLDEVVRIVTASPYANPRPVEATALRILLQNAFEGRDPR